MKGMLSKNRVLGLPRPTWLGRNTVRIPRQSGYFSPGTPICSWKWHFKPLCVKITKNVCWWLLHQFRFFTELSWELLLIWIRKLREANRLLLFSFLNMIKVGLKLGSLQCFQFIHGLDFLSSLHWARMERRSPRLNSSPSESSLPGV